MGDVYEFGEHVNTLHYDEAAEHDDGSVLLGEALRDGERPHDVGHVAAGHVLHRLERLRESADWSFTQPRVHLLCPVP